MWASSMASWSIGEPARVQSPPGPGRSADRWETGTQNHEGLAGVTAAVEYLAWVGEQFGEPHAAGVRGYDGRRAR